MAKKKKAPKPKLRQTKAVRIPRLIRSVDSQVQPLFQVYREQLAATTREDSRAAIGSILVKVISSLLRIVESTAGFTPAERKAAVLKMVGDFYDQVFTPMIVEKFPLVGNRWIAPAGREMFLEIASGAIDSLTDIFNRTGWFDVPAGTNGAQPVPTDPHTTLPSGFTPY